jgi:argininosuccinate lyase
VTAARHQERLASEPDSLIQEIWGRPGIAAALPQLATYLAVHRAHAVMLIDTGILASDYGAAILAALDRIEREGSEGIAVRPELNDLFTCTDMRIVELLGEEVGGRLHTGRSRNDFALTIARLSLRTWLLELFDAVVTVCETLLHRAGEHSRTIFPGYTHHSQQAQPVTFGHFLLGHHDAFLRDLERLRGVYERTNRSPLGGVALAGTGFPIDRERTAKLLGFDGLVEHTADASGGRDFELEAASVAAIATSTADRLAESLILFTSAEFGYVELADGAASVSSIMPQKKNPVGLEMVEGLHSRAVGRLATIFVLLKSTTLGMGREPAYCDRELEDTVQAAIAAFRLLHLVLVGLHVDAERALTSVAEGMSTTTELADTLVREHNLSFHQAHRVVGRAVTLAEADRSRLSVDVVESAARKTLGHELGLDERMLDGALSPEGNVLSRRTRGGPAPDEVERMLSDRSARVATARDWLDATRSNLAAAAERLRHAADTRREATKEGA